MSNRVPGAAAQDKKIKNTNSKRKIVVKPSSTNYINGVLIILQLCSRNSKRELLPR